MSDLPAEAVTAAALAVHRADCDCDGNCADAPDEVDVEYATAALEAAAPALRAQGATAERERIRAGVDRIRETCHTPFSRALLDEFAELLDGGGDE